MATIIDANWNGYNLILAKTKNNFENKKIYYTTLFIIQSEDADIYYGVMTDINI